jgi:hypothetical protein
MFIVIVLLEQQHSSKKKMMTTKGVHGCHLLGGSTQDGKKMMTMMNARSLSSSSW